MIDPTELMKRAIEICRHGIALGQSPFGCAIARDDRVVAVEHNIVLLTTDITAHAEITALRTACRAERDIHLPGAIVATTCEPCPMCLAALHWARVETVYYGASIADAQSAGFNEMKTPAAEIARLGGCKVRLLRGILTKECRALFDEWKASPNARAY